MADGDYLKCPCKECGNNIEFPPHMMRDTIPCPHCGEWTELHRPGEPEPGADDEGLSPKTVGLASVAVLLVVSLGIFFFSGPKKTARTPQPIVATAAKAIIPPATPVVTPKKTNVIAVVTPVVEDPDKSRPKSPDDLKVAEIKLEKTKGSSLVYAAGTVENHSAYQRFGVKVQLDLLNHQGVKIGVTQDYKDIIEPHQEWRFHALIPDDKAVAVKLISLKED